MPEVASTSIKPSVSTVASVGLGIPIATVLSWLLDVSVHVEMPGPVEAAVGVIIGAAVGYFFHGGKSDDTV